MFGVVVVVVIGFLIKMVVGLFMGKVLNVLMVVKDLWGGEVFKDVMLIFLKDESL